MKSIRSSTLPDTSSSRTRLKGALVADTSRTARSTPPSVTVKSLASGRRRRGRAVCDARLHARERGAGGRAHVEGEAAREPSVGPRPRRPSVSAYSPTSRGATLRMALMSSVSPLRMIARAASVSVRSRRSEGTRSSSLTPKRTTPRAVSRLSRTRRSSAVFFASAFSAAARFFASAFAASSCFFASSLLRPLLPLRLLAPRAFDFRARAMRPPLRARSGTQLDVSAIFV